MTTVSEGSTKFGGLCGDYARVMVIDDRVLILAVDAMDEGPVTIAMTPEQARDLAQGIIAAADRAEGKQ